MHAFFSHMICWHCSQHWQFHKRNYHLMIQLLQFIFQNYSLELVTGQYLQRQIDKNPKPLSLKTIIFLKRKHFTLLSKQCILALVILATLLAQVPYYPMESPERTGKLSSTSIFPRQHGNGDLVAISYHCRSPGLAYNGLSGSKSPRWRRPVCLCDCPWCKWLVISRIQCGTIVL